MSPDPDLDDPAVWAGFLLGLERGAASGHTSGYEQGLDDGDRTLREAVGGFFAEHPVRALIRDLDRDAARQAAAARPVDSRTGPQLVRDAYLSWDLTPPDDVRAAAARDDGLDDAAGF